MKNIRQSNINIHKDAWVEINLEYLAQNIIAIKKMIPQNKKMMAIVKADAYGHGAQMLAQTMLASGVDAFGVSSIDEGLDLRQVKIKAPTRQSAYEACKKWQAEAHSIYETVYEMLIQE